MINFDLGADMIWFIVGLVFLVLEALTPGLFMIFFGLGAWAAAGLALAGLGLTAQFTGFMAVSLVSLAVFRQKLQRFLLARRPLREELDDPVAADQYLGREVAVIGEIDPDRPGLVELGGVNWRARSEGGNFRPGDRARVRGREGLTLVVEKISPPAAG